MQPTNPDLHDWMNCMTGCIKAVTRGGVFWVFEHPRNFREKLDTQKQITHLLLFMPSTSLEMHRNRFRPGLHWGSLQRSLRPLAGGEGARRVLPKNSTPSSALRASAIQAMLCRPPTLGQLSLASLRGRLIEYQLRLG